ncbi:Proteophosphoglycan ppg4 [Rhodotorula toruloides]|nr:Proteophosphoglycan ppg4 [Rhodotorula toruloides]
MPSQVVPQPNEATPAPIRRLPPELLSLIFEFCDVFPQRKSTLRALCLVSREFYSLAAPVLYRKIKTAFGERAMLGSWYWQRRETSHTRLLGTLETSEKVAKLVPLPTADPDRQARFRIPAMPKLRTAEVTLVYRWNRSPDYSEGALLTLAKAAPNLRILDLRKLNEELDKTLKKVAKLGNQFWEAWPKLEKVIVKKVRWEESASRKKVAKDAEAWDIGIELV